MKIEYPMESKDLIFRKPVFEDWQSIYKNVWMHEETAKYMLWNVTKSEEAAQERMRRTLQFQSTTDTSFFIYEKASGQCIGFAGVEEVEPGVFEDIGVAIGPKYVGKGYGRQTFCALIDMARAKNGTVFIGSCRHPNAASAAMQKSCGLVYDHSEDRIDPRNGSEYQLDYYKLALK